MPAWGTELPEVQIWKIAAYIKSLRTPLEPQPPSMERYVHAIGILLLPVVLAMRGQAQSTLDPAGPAAKSLSDLSWFVFILFTAVAVVMCSLIAWVATRRRGTFDEHEPVDAGGGQLWILIGGFAIPFVILAAVFILGLRAVTRFPLHDGYVMDPEIRLIGHQWWWEARYVGGPPNNQFVTANEIHIPVGRPVNIELSSADVIHSSGFRTSAGRST